MFSYTNVQKNVQTIYQPRIKLFGNVQTIYHSRGSDFDHGAKVQGNKKGPRTITPKLQNSNGHLQHGQGHPGPPHRRAGRGRARLRSHRASVAAPGRCPARAWSCYSASAPVAQVDRQACVSDRRPALVVQTLQKPYRDLLSSNSKTSQHMWSQIMTTCFSSRPSRETPAPLTQVASSWHCATARCATSGCKRS